MSANKSSAVADQEPIDVLFAVHDKFDLLDFAGSLEVFHTACHDFHDPENSKAFEITIVGPEPKVISSQGVIVGSQISYKDAHDRLEDFDLLVVVGGNSQEILDKELEPLSLITDFSELQKRDPARERTILSVCTGALFLAKQGILSGLSATTHPDHLTKFENLCSDAATQTLLERTDVIEDARYVVNNLRFDLGDEDENPYIRRKSDAGRRPSNARKGSMSFKVSNRRESIARRAAMRLGGLRVVTSGGVSAGVDAALYLVSAMVDEACAVEVARTLQWSWNKGVVVDGLDV
ncbi:class I glutamine amidotransferase-like protein [Ilyonectria sp. MPI-CAGE-AT-0026]|nr:class I glutamine amidotransferase-like protein [Ilyonectria sp. MPI-CAGE-AT-0026]